MIFKKQLLIAALFSLGISPFFYPPAYAVDTEGGDEQLSVVKNDTKPTLSSKFKIHQSMSSLLGKGSLTVQKLENTSLYTVIYEGDLFFTDESGSVLIKGDIFELSSATNISKVIKAQLEAALIVERAKSSSYGFDRFMEIGSQATTPKATTPTVISSSTIPDDVSEPDDALKAALPTKTREDEKLAAAIKSVPAIEPSSLNVSSDSFKKQCLSVVVESVDLFALYENFSQMGESERVKCGQIFAASYLPKLPDSEFVVYPARGKAKETLTILTDYTCSHCREMHKQIPDLNEAGVTVRYYLFGREKYSAKGSDFLTTVAMNTISAACAEDPNQAVDALYMHPSSYSPLKPSPECQQQQMRRKFYGNIYTSGYTPFIVSSKGQIGDGYLPTKQLLKYFNVT